MAILDDEISAREAIEACEKYGRPFERLYVNPIKTGLSNAV